MAATYPPIAIVGAGVVAQTLGRLLFESGASVVALAGRDTSRAEHAARFVGASVRVVTLAELPGLATHLLVAVSDQGITPVADALAAAGFASGVALHTCGARGPEALAPLRNVGVACGVLHPLQTITTPEQGVKSLVNVTFGVAGDPRAMTWAEHIVTSLHGRLLRIEADRLSYYHAGAVMASGGLIAALDAALVLFARAGITREAALCALGPLARTSLENALEKGPGAALTGPVLRGDAGTIAAHMGAVRDAGPTVATLYRAAAEHALGLARERGLTDVSVRAIQSLLDASSSKSIDGSARQAIGPGSEPVYDAQPLDDETE